MAWVQGLDKKMGDIKYAYEFWYLSIFDVITIEAMFTVVAINHNFRSTNHNGCKIKTEEMSQLQPQLLKFCRKFSILYILICGLSMIFSWVLSTSTVYLAWITLRLNQVSSSQILSKIAYCYCLLSRRFDMRRMQNPKLDKELSPF